jgi:hypothetical protein
MPVDLVGYVGVQASEMMSPMTDQWSCSHFSIANPRDDGASDLPELLRRLAAEFERRDIKATEILDVTIANEITEDGPWWSATVYWSPDGPKAK